MSDPAANSTNPIALIVDSSLSAVPYWEATRKSAARIYSLLANSTQLSLHLLGVAAPVSQKTLEQAPPPSHGKEATPCSLIAPILERLAGQEQRYFLIVIGSGEIFDLDDWICDPLIEGWLLVRSGEESLQGNSRRFPEIVPDDIEGSEPPLNYFSPSVRDPNECSALEDYQGYYEWDVDASGYPLIFIQTLGFFVHLFPVTKPQFEKFMASGRSQGFDDQYYQEILEMNPRSSYRGQVDTPIEQLLMTGVTIEETTAFSRWLGREYTLLNAEEWRICYEWLARRPATSVPPEIRSRLSRDALAIWEIIENQCQRRTLAELSLVAQGILEWVMERQGKYYALGDPRSLKYFRSAFDPVVPLEPRLKDLGFRLRGRKM